MKIFNYICNNQKRKMLEAVRHNIDWISGAVYGSVMAAATETSMLLINTALVTITAFFVKKFAEWLYKKVTKKTEVNESED